MFHRRGKKRVADDIVLIVRFIGCYMNREIVSLLVEMAADDYYYYGSDDSDDTDTTGPFSPNEGSPLLTPVSLTALFSLDTQQPNTSTVFSENV